MPLALRRSALVDATDAPAVSKPEHIAATPDLAKATLARRYTGLLLLASDLTAIGASALLASITHYLLILRPEGMHAGEPWAIVGADTRLFVFAALQLGAIVWFHLAGHYSKRRPMWDEIAQTTRILAFLAAADAITLYLLKLPFSRFWFLATWTLAMMLVPFARSMVKDLLIRGGIWQRPAMVLGTGDNALATVNALRDEPSMGLVPIALIAADGNTNENAPAGAPAPKSTSANASLPVISVGELESLVPKDSRGLTIFVALDNYQSSSDSRIIHKIRHLFQDILIVPPITGFPLYGAEVHHLFRQDVFFLTIRNNLGSGTTRLVKRVFDICIASILLIALWPLFLYFYFRIRADGGPAIFVHWRVGANGQPFPCYKFRTMVPNAEHKLRDLLEQHVAMRREWEANFKLTDDPRITKIGRFLRRSSLDELPQLWNVLTGDMSLVGPRPVVSEELERYGDDAFYYLETRPGITGVWQVSGRSDVDYAFRVYLDSWYVKNWSLWYDIVILIKTIRVVAARVGAY